MGLSASQARFLQLTARKSDIEYEVQQISFQRLQIAEKQGAASTKYQEATNNRKMVFNFNNGQGIQKVDLTYTNYKNYMNQQDSNLVGVPQYYLVSSSGNKIVVASEEERDEMIKNNTSKTSLSSVESAKKQYEEAQTNGTLDDLGSNIIELATTDFSTFAIETEIDSEGNKIEYYITEQTLNEDDFLIAEDLNDMDAFQSALQEGIYFFATREKNEDGEYENKVKSWESLGAGSAISEEYDKTDDTAAEAEYNAAQTKLQKIDKKLELRLDQLETARSAIETEMDSVKKVVEDNIEQTFKTLG